ncbi:CGNR zinc finger domain-containing protein [Lysobacter sp. K5869]|uniref:CGNR zinc finger domain-containing protein n=1 Tax=Lysobacter sp. K5869 TaxID=2820808 RepID=UPI001C060A10|nr:ABATE domain-containing protein [Lysobacter sp. K5869]QWP75763.1 CGNR zinc finger domain-containing protein [Lysobacter sp. K5869]
MTTPTPTDWPPLIAGQPALDLLNTLTLENGALVEHLGDDAAAAAWLSRATGAAQAPQPHLAERARELREAVRAAVESLKRAQPVDLAPLNALFARMHSHLVLRPSDAGFALHREAVGDPAWLALAPLGEAAAQLLAQTDFALVRQCEHAECVLWFHDTTKSHRRRWCSMALCGNRYKVSEFRKRRGG